MISLPSVRASLRYRKRFLEAYFESGKLHGESLVARMDVRNIHPLSAEATDPAFFELLDFCVAFYLLDRATARPVNGWRRDFILTFPVASERVDLWRRNRALVREWIFALTNDIVEVNPVPRKDLAEHHDRSPVLAFDQGEIDVVGLVSDGLDSLCGIDELANSASRRFALASVITKGKRRKRIRKTCAHASRILGREIPHYSVQTNLFGSRDKRANELTQRSRTILAVVTGMTVAALLGADIVECYENGIGLLNLPIPDLQYGAMASQVLQPAHLPLWDQVGRAFFFNRTIQLRFPNRFLTKADMIDRLSPAGRKLVRSTFSCDSESRYLKGLGIRHCGVCASCQLRKLAISSTTVDVRDAPYADVAPNAEDPDAELCLRYHASLLDSALRSPATWEALTTLQHELDAVQFSDDHRVQSPVSLKAHRLHIIEQTIELIRRHVNQVHLWNCPKDDTRALV